MFLEAILARKNILHCEILSLTEEYKIKESGTHITEGDLVVLEPTILMTPEELAGKTFTTPVSPIPAFIDQSILIGSGNSNKSLKRRADLLGKTYRLKDIAKESFERLKK
jgi:hypothetical protein